MKNTNKKGFTIVELVIVIAVIAILAAVLIPTFAGLVAKANLSADQQAVNQMNKALAMGSAEYVTEDLTIEKIGVILNDAGFNMENGINALRTGYSICWFKDYNTIVLAEGDKVVYPTNNDKLAADFQTNHADKTKVFDLRKLVDGSSVVVNGEIVGSIVEALTTGGEITLFTDVTINSAVTINSDTVINLNGNKIETSQSIGRPFEIKEAGIKLTINAEGSTVQLGKYGLVDIKDNADNVEVTINGGTFIGELDNGGFLKVRPTSKDGVTDAKFVLNNVNVTITENNSSKPSYLLDATYSEDGKNKTEKINVTVEVNGGTYNTGYGFHACDSLVVNNATINAIETPISECKNALIENSTLTTTATKNDENWSACVVVSGEKNATIKNSTLTAVNGYVANVLPTGGSITLEGCTVTPDAYHVHDMESGKTGSIIVDGNVVLSK